MADLEYQMEHFSVPEGEKVTAKTRCRLHTAWKTTRLHVGFYPCEFVRLRVLYYPFNCFILVLIILCLLPPTVSVHMLLVARRRSESCHLPRIVRRVYETVFRCKS